MLTGYLLHTDVPHHALCHTAHLRAAAAPAAAAAAVQHTDLWHTQLENAEAGYSWVRQCAYHSHAESSEAQVTLMLPEPQRQPSWLPQARRTPLAMLSWSSATLTGAALQISSQPGQHSVSRVLPPAKQPAVCVPSSFSHNVAACNNCTSCRSACP